MKRKYQINLAPLVALLVLTSCATTNTPVSVAEKTSQSAFYSMNLFVHLERDNRGLGYKITPDGTIYNVAQKVRTYGLDAVERANRLTRVYKEKKNAANQTALNTALAVVAELMADVNFYLPKLQTAIATKKAN